MKINSSDYNSLDKLIKHSKIANNNDSSDFVIKDNQNENDLLKGESAAVIAGAKIIQEKGYKVDKETINNLREYFGQDKSSFSEKLDTLKLALEKEIPLKESLLSKIQFNSSISMLDFIEDIELLEFGEKKDKNDDDIKRYGSVKRELRRNEKLLKNIFDIVNKKIDEKSLDFNSKNETNALEIKKKIQSEIKDAARLLEEAHSELYDYDEINNIEKTDFETIYEKDMELIANYLYASQNINSFSGNTQAILEVKVTQKLLDLRHEFVNLKKDISQDILRISDSTTNLSKQDKVNILFESIEKLDSAIMKSEMSLYIDLKGEKELIKLSSQLEIARKELEKGNIREAEKILKAAKLSLDNLKYEPSIKKAFVVFNDKNINANSSMKDIETWLKNSAHRYSDSEKSVSNMINYLRKMGINNDVEEFQNIQNSQNTSRDAREGEFKNLLNLKELLMKMNQNTSEKTGESKANKMIEHIEGSQMKNKILDNKMPQSVEIELPIKLSGRIKNVKVFIKSPQKMLKLDWENFDMYFVLSSEKLGEMGIRVSAVQKNLTVKIINDKAERLSKEKNIGKEFKSELKELGYKLSKMVLEAWNNPDKEASLTYEKEKQETVIPSKDSLKIDIKI